MLHASLAPFSNTGHFEAHAMFDTIKISVDGQDGDLVARTSGIRFVTPDNDLALVRVSYFEDQVTAYYFQCRSNAKKLYFVVALLAVLVSCLGASPR